MDKKKSFLVSAAYYIAVIGIIYAVLKYAVPLVMPFIIGFVIAALLSPLVKLLTRRYRMKRRPTAVFILILFYTTVGMLASVLAVQLTLKLGELSTRLPEIYKNSIEPSISGVIGAINDLIARFSNVFDRNFAGTVSALLDSAKSSLGVAVSDISVMLLTKLSAFAATIPAFLIGLVFSVISSFFFICDFDKLIAYIKNRLPERTVGLIADIGERIRVIGTKYVRSYVLIMLITFAELLVGLMLIGTKNAFAWAAVIALLDFLPVIGSGAVMVPWAAVQLIIGNTVHGVGLLLVLLMITVVRNIVEPKIVGSQVGLHPLAALVSMFVGTKLFGFIGLILFPIGVSIAAPIITERFENHDRAERDS